MIDCDKLNDNKDIYFKYTVKCTGHIDHMELDLPVKNAPVEEVTIEISYDGINYNDAISIEAKAGRWVGVKHGIFIAHNSEVKEEGGSIIVDYVRYE